MIISLMELYKCFNRLENYSNSFPVEKSITMARIYKEYLGQDVQIDKIIYEYEKESYSLNGDKGTLYLENKCLQPKSFMFRLLLLELLLDSIPDNFYNKIKIDRASLLGISYAIALYYLGLQTEYFTDIKMNNTEKKNLLKSEDFSFSLNDILLIRGNTEENVFDNYIKLFAVSLQDLDENEEACLFSEDNKSFIFCSEDFIEYVVLELEKQFRKFASNEEYNFFTRRKGELFEKLVFELLSDTFQDSYHTVYYNPNDHQKMELDVVVRNSKNIGIFECKSGTFDISSINQDDLIKLQIQNKTKKAYKTLKTAWEYFSSNSEYILNTENDEIIGKAENVYLVHVSMYSMDFISSNLHALIEEYLNEENPIISISIEHLLAIIIDTQDKDYNLFDYLQKRKEFVIKYPKIFYENNELDLYFQIMNEDSMLNEMYKNGFLNQINPNCKITASFRNQYGEEVRPAGDMLKTLDSRMLWRVIKIGKSRYGLNKRYLKNLDTYLRVEK